MSINNYKRAFENLPKGVLEAEVHQETKEAIRVNVLKGEQKDVDIHSRSAYYVRATGKTIGVTYTEQLGEDPYQLIARALESADTIQNGDRVEFTSPGGKYPQQVVMQRPFTVKELLDKALQLEKYTLSCFEDVKSTAHCSLAYEKYSDEILNSLGLHVKGESSHVVASITAIAEKDGQMCDYAVSYMAPTFSELDLKEIGSHAASFAKAQLVAQPIKSGNYDILISNLAARDLLKATWGALSAGQSSVFADRIGDKIGSAALSIKDVPSHPKSGVVWRFDCEGTPARNRVLIEKGILKTMLHTRKTAKKQGVESTGNAGHRYAFSGYTAIGVNVVPQNIYVEPGSKNQQQMLEQLKNGIFITSFPDVYHGISNVTGRISIPCIGFLVENGQISRAVNQLILTGSLPDMYENIETIGSDLEFMTFLDSYCIGSPSILIRNQYIAS